MRKTVYTLNVDNYAPDLARYTRPLIDRYAQKIGADRFEITTRKWPDTAPVYEKLQIYDLALLRDDDWSLYVDLDALIHPDLYDPTDLVPMDTVGHHGADIAGNRWKIDDVFRRDGRMIGSCNWFTWASRWCRDLWAQPDIPYAECVARCVPIHIERSKGVQPSHLVDDYILSRNIARFGLKFKTILGLMKDMDDASDYTHHRYLETRFEKGQEMRRVLGSWVLSDYRDPHIPGWMSPNELTWLYLTAQEYQTIVEVGCWRGKSTHAILSGCKGRVTSVDHFKGSRGEQDLAHYQARTTDIKADLLRNVGTFDHFELIESDSVEAAARFADDSVDMVFLDGAHDYEGFVRDVRAWWPKCKSLLCGHDLIPSRDDPNWMNAIRRALSDMQFVYRQESGSCWSVNKRREFDG